jgi:DnaJ-class molecular chaperone
MDLEKDYYAILGILPTAEPIAIRAVYKALLQRYHPDKFRGSIEESERITLEINEAYAVLSDSVKRKQYDDFRGGKTQDSGEVLLGDRVGA